MKCFLMGDYNIDLLRKGNCSIPQDFVALMFSYGYMPLILRPTRVPGRSATLIDNIWINNETLLVNSGIIKCDISDHFPEFANVIGGSIATDWGSTQVYYTKK